jgi:Alpha/beta hydrolase domain
LGLVDSEVLKRRCILLDTAGWCNYWRQALSGRVNTVLGRGGIRLPQVEVPLTTNSAVPAPANPLGFLAGSCVPFPPEKLRALYGDADGYLARFEQATRGAEKAGVLLARDTEPLVRDAKAAFERAVISGPG